MRSLKFLLPRICTARPVKILSLRCITLSSKYATISSYGCGWEDNMLNVFYKDCLELRSVLFYMACCHCFQDKDASHSNLYRGTFCMKISTICRIMRHWL